MDEQLTEGKGYSTLATILATLAIFFLGQFLGVVLSVLIPVVGGWNDQQTTTWFKSTQGVFVYIACVEAFTVGLLAWFAHRRQITFRDLGINNPRIKHVGYALLGFGLYFISYIVFIVIVRKLFPGLNIDQEQEIGFDTSVQGQQLILVFISLAILPPIAEELLMRGFLFTGLRKRLTFTHATIITSFLFAIAHLPAGKGGLLWVGAIDTFILSIALCYLREITGSLWPSIGVHMIKNAVAFVVLFDVLN